MCKKFMTIVISCAILATVALTGCGEDSTANTTNSGVSSGVTESAETEGNGTGSATDTGSETENATTDSTAEYATTASTEDGEIIVDDTAHDEYEFVDESVTNPTVAPYEVSTENENARIANSITVDSLTGSWLPLTATAVSDGVEVGFAEAFGSAYSQYSGSLEITEGGNFTISMGASVKEGQTSGTFTLSQYNMLVTYADGSADTFLYIPNYQNHQVIKTQIDNYYVYFYKI